MSNRLVSLFILVLIIWWLVWAYLYLFVYYTWNIVLVWNQKNFEVSFYSDTIKRTIKQNCEKNICEINKLPPLSYTMTISKEWFKDFTQTIKIQRNKQTDFKFLLKKASLLIEQKELATDNSSKSKIEQLRELWTIKNSYKYFDLWEAWIFYFMENSWSLSLYSYSSWITNKIYDLETTDKENLNLSKVYATNDEIFIESSKNKHIYNLSNWKSIDFDISIPVLYVKKSSILWNYQVVTEKWTFVYSENSKKLEYVPVFSDYVNYDNKSYIWIILSSDTQRKTDYNISWNDNLIIYYNYFSKEKKILLDTSLTPSKLVNENGNVYFYDENNKKYLLEVWE